MKIWLSVGLLLFTYIQTALPASRETWAYLYKGEEKLFPAQSAITDIACFSAQINADGGLSGGHTAPPTLPGARTDARYHLVITVPWNKTLSHIYLNKELPLRNRAIAAIVQRAAPFDGVQIDIEAIDKADRMAYIDFLATLRQQLPRDKCFSVAVMARWDDYMKSHPQDPFDYRLISRFCDRIVVMAYDEHYGGGRPGPIASLPWCKKIFAHAQQTVPAEKLVMGLPLYGRSWQSPSHAKTYKNRDLAAFIANQGIHPTTDASEGGSFSRTETVTVTTQFETTESILAKRHLYESGQIRGVAYWRLGQEPNGFWQLH